MAFCQPVIRLTLRGIAAGSRSVQPGAGAEALEQRVARVAASDDDLGQRVGPEALRGSDAGVSRVAEPAGATGWTHVFEQEFSDLHGLMGPYLMHPIHWAVVDRWFDPECPEYIVRERVCHSFCALHTSVRG